MKILFQNTLFYNDDCTDHCQRPQFPGIDSCIRGRVHKDINASSVLALYIFLFGLLRGKKMFPNCQRQV
jgi:hypothetical protein